MATDMAEVASADQDHERENVHPANVPIPVRRPPHGPYAGVYDIRCPLAISTHAGL